MIWGFEGRPSWAVATTLDRCFSSDVPISLNCTSFANLMLSVWMQGNAHRTPYDASQMVGGDDPLGARYALHAVNDNEIVFLGYCFDVDGIRRNAQPNRLYYIGLCDSNGMIKHDTVFLNGKFYESNTDKTPAVYSTPLEERFKRAARNGGGVCLYGPMPF